MNADQALQTLDERRPLVHHLTNYVTVNLVANVTLCTGALPVMAQSREEVEEMASNASALVINLGTLDAHFVDAALAAGREANRRGAPVVMDPVGAGATALRTRSAERVLSELTVAAVCGNAGEIATLAGLSAEVRGVESLAGDARAATSEAARALGTMAVATGATDYIAGGGEIFAVENGHPLMGRLVGSGCASTAVVGCFAAAQALAGGGSDELEPETVAAALAYFGRAGEIAAEKSDGPGTLEPRLLDALASVAGKPGSLRDALRIRES